MFDPRIKIDKQLYDRLAKAAEVAGYSSTDEFIMHLLETAAGSGTEQESEEEVRKRLQGLGYID
jgi:metal-responsive CopG/Arc/MetJ family transcriptional regulator